MYTPRDEIELEIDRLQRGVELFGDQVRALQPGSFLELAGRWTPRDMVAHLIGWTRYIVPGSEQIRRGQLPFYDLDPGDNFSNVNAQLVRDYPSKDPDTLLAELDAAAGELIAYLRRLDPEDWERDFGVRHRGEKVTIASTVGEVIDDFAHHARQLGELARS